MSDKQDIFRRGRASVPARFLWGVFVDVLEALLLGLHVELFLGSLLLLEIVDCEQGLVKGATLGK